MKIPDFIKNPYLKLVGFLKSSRFQNLVHLQLEVRPYLQGVPYWTAGVLVGFIAVVYSDLFSMAMRFAVWVRDLNPYFMYILTPFTFVFATLLVEKFALPAGGAGVAKVTEALSLDEKVDAPKIHELINLRVGLIIILSSLLATMGGGGLGREGPMIHIAACVFYFVGRQFHKIRPYQEHRSWILAGGAAGISAAFNAPLAGVVFVLEELAQQHFHKFKSVVITAAIIGGVISQWLSGRYLYFGFAKIEAVPLSALPWAVGLGIVCGVCAFPFHQMLSPGFQALTRKYLNTRLKFAFFSGLCVAALSIWVSPFAMGGGTSLVEELLSKNDFHADWKIIVARFLSPILTHLSGCAGGFLAPSLALGGALGSQFAFLIHYPNASLLVMVGMAAFLSATVRAPFTAWVIVMEMTSSHSAIFPLMLASLVSWKTLRVIEQRLKKKEVDGSSF